MKRSFFLIILVVFLGKASFAQEHEIEIHETYGLYSVVVWHPSFEGMCKAIANEFNITGQQIISLATKVLPPARARYRGEEWEVLHQKDENGKRVFISRESLPELVQQIHGKDALNVRLIACYLSDQMIVSTEHLTINVVDKAAAYRVRDMLR